MQLEHLRIRLQADILHQLTLGVCGLTDVRLVWDVVSLDSALQNSYAEHVLSGRSLPINYGTYITMQHTVVGDNISVKVSRAVSKLKTIFCSFDGDFNPTPADKVAYPYYLVKRPFNFFYHPMGKRLSDSEGEDKIGYDFKKELEYQIQVPSKSPSIRVVQCLKLIQN